MLKVGITGGIGSGKSTVCQVFETLGIPVFYADREARILTDTDPAIVSGIKELFGEEIYIDGKLDRIKVAEAAFNNNGILQQINGIIHPATIEYGKRWMLSQTAPYVIKEAAIFFETGSNKDMDVMIGVTAPLNIRVKRIMQRDNTTKAKVLDRVSKQMDEEEKMDRCDHVIINDGISAIIPQVLALHELLLRRAN
jgi:dephospho-CoA kinase